MNMTKQKFYEFAIMMRENSKILFENEIVPLGFENSILYWNSIKMHNMSINDLELRNLKDD